MYWRPVVLAIVLCIVGAASASAATSQTQHFRFHGSGAEAEWFRPTATGAVFADLEVTTSQKGNQLFADLTRFTDTQEIDWTLDVTHGFTVSVDRKGLTTASVSGTGLPAERCVYDFDGNQLGCSHVSINVSAHWTGVGSIAKETFNDHFSQDGFKETFHSNDVNRRATASATIAGVSFSPADQDFGTIFRRNSSDVTICHGGC